MTKTSDLASLALAASAYESIDAAPSVEAVQRIVANFEAVRLFARRVKNTQLETDIKKIRLYAEVRLFELTAQRQSEPA